MPKHGTSLIRVGVVCWGFSLVIMFFHCRSNCLIKIQWWILKSTNIDRRWVLYIYYILVILYLLLRLFKAFSILAPSKLDFHFFFFPSWQKWIIKSFLFNIHTMEGLYANLDFNDAFQIKITRGPSNFSKSINNPSKVWYLLEDPSFKII